MKQVYLLFILLLVLTGCDEDKDTPSTLKEGNQPEAVEPDSNLIEEDKPLWLNYLLGLREDNF